MTRYLKDKYGKTVAVVSEGETPTNSAGVKSHMILVEDEAGFIGIWGQPNPPEPPSTIDIIIAYAQNEIYDEMTPHHLKGHGF